MTNEEQILSILTILSKDVNVLSKDVNTLSKDVCEIKRDMKDVKQRVTNLEVTQETEIIPRLKEIESCYLDTYKRYQDGSEDIDSLKTDVTMIKRFLAQVR